MVHSVELNSMPCSNCGKKLAEVKIEKGIFSIKCSKCGTINRVEINTQSVKERQ